MVTDEQIQRWADEAEVGYDIETLKRRGRGRPGRGAEPMQVVAVRLTEEEIAALDAVARRIRGGRIETTSDHHHACRRGSPVRLHRRRTPPK